MYVWLIMLLSGSKVYLRNMKYAIRKIDVNTDIPVLFEIDNNNQFNGDLLCKLKYNSYNEFNRLLVENLNSFFHDSFIITCASSIVGVFYTYDYRFYDCNCKINICFLKSVLTEADFKNIIKGMITSIFRDYPLKKIIAEVSSEDVELYKFYESIGFAKECTLSEYKFFNGHYIDVHIMENVRKG